jgi:hypothetical protein
MEVSYKVDDQVVVVVFVVYVKVVLRGAVLIAGGQVEIPIIVEITPGDAVGASGAELLLLGEGAVSVVYVEVVRIGRPEVTVSDGKIEIPIVVIVAPDET